MSKLTRVTHTIFGGSAPAAVNGIAQFGSKQAGTPTYTTNIATLQALAAWLNGWGSAVVSGKVPPLEELNAAFLEPSYQIGYLLEMGIPEYDAGTTYYTNSIVQSNGIIYISLVDNNIGNTPSISPSQWAIHLFNYFKGQNLFRNSSMVIQSRNYSGTITAGTPAYSVDGWILGCSGANMGWSLIPNSTNLLRLLGGSGLTDCFIKQRIESLIMAPYVNAGNQTLTYQALVHNNTGATLTPTLSVNAPTAWPDNYTGTVSVLAATNLQSISSGATQVVSYTFSVASVADIINGLEVILDFGAANNSGTGYIEVGQFDLSSTGLPVGLTFTPPAPQIRPMAEELSFNRRYLYSVGTQRASTAQVIIGMGMAFTTSTAFFPIQLEIPMAKKPTLSLFSSTGGGTGALNLVNASSGPYSLTLLSLGSQTSDVVLSISGTVSGTPLSLNTPYFMETDGSNDIHILLSAEL
ncbi:MAG: hypothetical protein KGJ90_07005 [Patescibacteria group bacterium]|nr:hypothetical protein [Patescibacteria group bacterium]